MQAVRADSANGSLAAAHARAAAVMTLIASHGALLHANTSAASSRGTRQSEGDADGNHHREQAKSIPAHGTDTAAAVAEAAAAAAGEEAGGGHSQQPAPEQGVQQSEHPSGQDPPGSDWAEMDEVEAGGSGAAIREHGGASPTAEAAADARESRNNWEQPQHPAATATPEEPLSDTRLSEQQQDRQHGSSRAAAEVAEAREHCLRVSTCRPPYHAESCSWPCWPVRDEVGIRTWRRLSDLKYSDISIQTA